MKIDCDYYVLWFVVPKSKTIILYYSEVIRSFKNWTQQGYANFEGYKNNRSKIIFNTSYPEM